MSYSTGMAAEFYVLSCLHRLGHQAYLTLGNHKAVDILVRFPDGSTCTIDVKAVADKSDYWVSAEPATLCARHLVVFVCFEGKIEDLRCLPSTWVVPFEKLKRYLAKGGIARTTLLREFEACKDGWAAVTPAALS